MGVIIQAEYKTKYPPPRTVLGLYDYSHICLLYLFTFQSKACKLLYWGYNTELQKENIDVSLPFRPGI